MEYFSQVLKQGGGISAGVGKSLMNVGSFSALFLDTSKGMSGIHSGTGETLANECFC